LLYTLSLFGFGAGGIAVMTGAFYGWGRLTRRFAGLPDGTWPFSVVLGLAVSIFFGGILNLCRLAYPAALAAVAVAGLALAAIAVRRDRALWWPISYYALAWGAVVAALTGLMIATQLAPALYNSYDDFQYYFPHAVRMVETGTLYGSPLNALGGEGLGGQTFLQGFVVGFFPLKFINAVDAVFCFFLCMALAGNERGKRGIGRGVVHLPSIRMTQSVCTPPDSNRPPCNRRIAESTGRAFPASTSNGGIASFPIQRTGTRFTSQPSAEASGTVP